MNNIPIKRALLSVADKTGIIEFAQELHQLGVEIISTGGTSKTLAEAKIPFRPVENLTGFPDMLDGRVKTLHPLIHGGILGRRDVHAEEAKTHELEWIDLVVVNFYPFEHATAAKTLSFAEAIEYIDVGGPTMVRAAAKNCAWVSVIVDPADYSPFIAKLKATDGIEEEMRKQLAMKVFARTARYEQAILDYMQNHLASDKKSDLILSFARQGELRYGENPHQAAASFVSLDDKQKGVLDAKQLQGKPLSYNNILDAEAALNCVSEFQKEPACVIIKHANPCGAAVGKEVLEAWEKALAGDSVSAFGGIVALNQPCDATVAKAMSQLFLEVIIAPKFTEEAIAIFAAKPNLRLLEMPHYSRATWEKRFIQGGLLMQEVDKQVVTANDMQVVTKVRPSDEALATMGFAWQILKHIKSNGILIAKAGATLGVGAGQVSRIDAVDLAIRKAGERVTGAVLASDAFFPFRDSIDRIAESGIQAIIQPGGSVRDEEVIQACDELGISMVFTGKRCFKH